MTAPMGHRGMVDLAQQECNILNRLLQEQNTLTTYEYYIIDYFVSGLVRVNPRAARAWETHKDN